ncbi:hypothetical protein OAS86_04700 [Gammaproteobacteria bacterium]|nr:hypothetical protein [Gammaproteobacteria bacterium]
MSRLRRVIRRWTTHHGLDLRPTCYSVARDDRHGAQVQDDLYAFAWARRHGLCFIGSVGEEHFEAHRGLCAILGLPLPSRDLTARHRRAQCLDPGVYRRGGDNVVFNSETLRILRSYYVYQNEPSERVTAVHIRRGDVNPQRHPKRYLPNAHYRRLIDQIRAVGPTRVQIFSESNFVESLDDFSDCELHLDTPLQQTWRAMIDADVLVMSHSSFSYVPALYNRGTVIYSPFWHGRLDHWLDCQSAGFTTQLARSLHEITEFSGSSG